MKFLAAALHIEDMVDHDTIEPSAKLAVALETAEPGDQLDEDFLGDFLGIFGPEYHADGNVIDPCLMPQN